LDCRNADAAKGEKLLNNAERSCLTSNSLIADYHLTLKIVRAILK